MRNFLYGVLAVALAVVLWWGVPTVGKWVRVVEAMTTQVGQVTGADGQVQVITVAEMSVFMARERMSQLEAQQKQQPQGPAPQAPSPGSK
jgi:hypothetical protein